MVPIVDRVVMHHIIELLKIHGITDIVVTVQYLANNIQDYFGDGSNYGVSISYSLEETPLGTAGSVKHAQHLLKEPFIIISGDALTDFNLTEIIEFHNTRKSLATLTLTRVPNPIDYASSSLMIVEMYVNSSKSQVGARFSPIRSIRAFM